MIGAAGPSVKRRQRALFLAARFRREALRLLLLGTIVVAGRAPLQLDVDLGVLPAFVPARFPVGVSPVRVIALRRSLAERFVSFFVNVVHGKFLSFYWGNVKSPIHSWLLWSSVRVLVNISFFPSGEKTGNTSAAG